MNDYKNFSDWCRDNQDNIFHYWVYRRIFTPYEQNNRFPDESMFEDIHANSGYIVECITLPDNDILIGFADPEASYDCVDYYKLSEIRLAYFATEYSIPE